MITDKLTLTMGLIASQLIRDLGITNGNESQVGYYVGLLVSFTRQR